MNIQISGLINGKSYNGLDLNSGKRIIVKKVYYLF